MDEENKVILCDRCNKSSGQELHGCSFQCELNNDCCADCEDICAMDV